MAQGSEALPVFDSLNKAMFGVSAVVATYLSFYRWWSHEEGRRGSWIADATSAWSILILFSLAASAFIRTVPVLGDLQVPTEIELIRSNGLMIPFSFSYCAIMLSRNLLTDFGPLFTRFRKRETAGR